LQLKRLTRLYLFLYLEMKFSIPISHLGSTLKETKQRSVAFSIARILVFLALVSLGIVGVTDSPTLLLGIAPILALFVYLIIRTNYYKDQELLILQLMEMEREEELRLNRNLKTLKSGEEYADKNHPFANDLDLFGEHSLFQMINHTVSKSGATLLANWIKAPLDREEALARNQGVKELTLDKEFLRFFEGIGRSFIKSEKTKKPFFDWLKTTESWQPSFFLPMVIGPLGGMGIIFLAATGLIAYSWLGIWILVGIGVLSLVFKSLKHVAYILPDQGDIKTFALWSEILESKNFKDPYLRKMQEGILQQDYSATKALKSLEQKTFLIQNRFNLMYLIFNMLFWLDFGVLWRLMVWKSRYGSQLSSIQSQFDRWQALVSLASFSNQEQVVCQLDWSESQEVSAKNIRHPLLKPSAAVSNNFDMPDKIHTVLLTGANMSGKTTFMRTLGINIVLANLGLQPFADHFKLGQYQLFTSMRNADNLGESVSSFYAELARIRQLLLAAESGTKVFFLMDEILKGTNTTDRIMGSEALIKQLAKAGAKGIISTHDIELAGLEESLHYLTNMSFHSDIQDQEILFDYTIKTGPCPSFNAHKLMELMGIRFGN
jgi:hypothetical protein